MESRVVVWSARGSGIALAVVPTLLLVLLAGWPAAETAMLMAMFFVVVSAIAVFVVNLIGEEKPSVYLISRPVVYAAILTATSNMVLGLLFGDGIAGAILLLVAAFMMANAVEKTEG